MELIKLIMEINKDWHLKNKMPKNPTPQERLKWHLEHSKNCRCRSLTPEYLKKLQKLVK
jgi:hypothetical protein